MTALEKHLVSLQAQLEHLNAEVAALLALTSANQSTSIEPAESVTIRSRNERAPDKRQKSPVGINRYRQLTND